MPKMNAVRQEGSGTTDASRIKDRIENCISDAAVDSGMGDCFIPDDIWCDFLERTGIAIESLFSEYESRNAA